MRLCTRMSSRCIFAAFAAVRKGRPSAYQRPLLHTQARNTHSTMGRERRLSVRTLARSEDLRRKFLKRC